MAETEIPESADTQKARALVAETLRRAFFNAGEYSGFDAQGLVKFSDAVDALIEHKIADAIEFMADRVQDATGIRP